MGQSTSCVLVHSKCSYPNPQCHCELDLTRCEPGGGKGCVEQQQLDFSSLCEVPVSSDIAPKMPRSTDEGPLEANSATRKLSAEAEDGVTQLDMWLASEIGDNQLTQAADAMLTKAMEKGSYKVLNDLKLLKQGRGAQTPMQPSMQTVVSYPSREPTPRSPRSPREPLLQSEARPAQSTLSQVFSSAFDSETDQAAPLREPSIQMEAPAPAEKAKRSVRFDEENLAIHNLDPPPPPERRGDILWHLLPQPEPPPDRKRRIVKGRRRNDETGSECSDGSDASNMSRGSAGSRSGALAGFNMV
eukprot:TRINITY_DN90841_c0_g1_i1.p1 TRINITY_DN90841_c0_g1~~TRINITY_DN90841_c0_g1_i1.p1  ORF type:complete len:301 (+),score=68.27 TRINITY_DN90841_c0_g1_i1:80-982(+)